MKYVTLLLFVLIFIAGCTTSIDKGGEIIMNNTEINTEQPNNPVDVSIQTSDNINIKGTFYPNSNSNKGIVLLHQLSLDRTSYSKAISLLQKTHNVLAIDLRGHGESSGNWKEFSDEDYNKMQLDTKASQQFLENKGIEIEKISYIGASIGANTVQNFVSNNKFDKAILLSPGKNFKGINLNMKDNGALVITSSEDTYSYDTAKVLEENSENSKFIYLDDKGHGTNMLDEEVINEIINFING